MEWEDGNGEEVEDSDDGSEEENVASPVRDESSDGNEEDETAHSMTPRVRRAPTYLNNFVSGGRLSDEGEEVVQFDGGIFIIQSKYVMEVLRRVGMEHSNSVENPMVPGFKISKDENGIEMDGSFFKQLIRSIMYLTATRPNIMYAVSLLSRYMSRPTEVHHSEAKRILCYLQGTTTFGILYRRGGSHELIGFTDSDYSGSVEDRRSTSGYVFMLSGAAVTWSSQKHPIATLSTTEAKIIEAAGSSCQAIWMQWVLKKIGYMGSDSNVTFCDSSSTIKLARNLVMHDRSKHFDVRYHLL
ncbi:hypothetical protein KIW84_051253 [Lathyrus oleraceus]|uniref:Reverse transcriptase Ty1/copia-type domain-containing protein n=1 Tax=Pisum sativum TaxID=3888 RepID=A0A9D4WLP3_PEA|nr:hypothetical protein KIW84_051253 [Pisum sativum]